MSLVERLADKWGNEHFNSMRPAPLSEPGDEYDARWWLNAIADELQSQMPTPASHDAEHPAVYAAKWLRSATRGDAE